MKNPESIRASWTVLFLLLAGALNAQITVSGGWTTTIDVNDLRTPGTPGSDINGTYLSTADVNITMNIGFGVGNYHVYVNRTDGAGWPSAWALAVRRTNNGLGFGSISGGTSFVPIPNGPPFPNPPYGVQFFTGNGWRFVIGLELQLSNVSVANAPASGTVNTRVTYTLTQP